MQNFRSYFSSNSYRGKMFTDQGNDGGLNKVIQFLQEHGTWLRSLDYLRQENYHLKTQIGNLARSPINEDMLQELEQFQNKFIEKDAVIGMLRQEIVVMDEQLKHVNPEHVIVGNDVIGKQDKMRTDIIAMEREFNLLKHNFNRYLAKY